MLRIVLPLVTASDVRAVAATDVVHAVATNDVRVAIEIVVDVNIDFVVSPASVPTPTAVTPRRADRNSDSK